MVVKEGYKNTEMGVIPEDWEVNRIGELTSLKNGYAFSSTFFSKTGPIVITPGNFKLSGGLKFTQKNTLRFSGDVKNEMKFKNGDLIIVMTDLTPTCDLLGKPGIINSDEVILHNQRIGKISIISNLLLKNYLFRFFTSEMFSKRMKETATGSTVRHTSVGSINNTIIPLPPLPEQTAIATVLSDTDNLIQALEKKIAKKELIKKGAMQELLEPKEGWEVKKLGEIGNTYGGLSGKSKSDFSNCNSKYIPFMNIMRNPIIDTEYLDSVYIKPNESQNTTLKGDLFFNGSSETPDEVGLCSVLLKNIPSLYLNSFCFGFRLYNQKEINGLYLSYYFRSNFGREKMTVLAQGATRYNLSKANFLKLEISIPSFKDQTHIAQILSDMDTEIESLQEKLSKYKQLKQGLMQELLTGRIRLV